MRPRYRRQTRQPLKDNRWTLDMLPHLDRLTTRYAHGFPVSLPAVGNRPPSPATLPAGLAAAGVRSRH
jgi:hypothetical protein